VSAVHAIVSVGPAKLTDLSQGVSMRTRVFLSVAAALAFTCAYLSAGPAKPALSIARAHRVSRGTSPQGSGESQIREVLATQVAAWNRGDIDSFMNFYWKSDRTVFVGANGVTRGWQAVLDRYHRSYPDRRAMGELTFSNLEIQQDCPDSAVVIGEYHLQREKDHPSGIFTLNFRKFPEGWRIVVDHTTAFATHSSQ
jgi:ketosteroid isomerase-like protein